MAMDCKRPVAQLGLFHNQSGEREWDKLEGVKRWLVYGPPKASRHPNASHPCERSGNYDKFICVDNGDLALDVCARCVELLPVFKLADGTEISGL